MAEPGRALPAPTPETQHFWDGTREGELRLQRCDGCGKTYFPPRPFCASCGSRKVSVFKASGKAVLWSYVIHHRPVPGFKPPYALNAFDDLEGDVRAGIARIKSDPHLLHSDNVRGFVFDVATGKLNEVR